MSFYEDASLIVLADGAYDSGIKAFKPVLNDSDPSDPNYLVPSGVGDFTVDRNSVATRVNADGLIEEVAANVPRFDYLNGSCPELLVEPQSTNLITYSEDFSDASWAKFDITVNSSSVLAPDGSNTATTVESTGSNDAIQFVYSGTALVDYSGSFYLKSTNGSNITVGIRVGDAGSVTTVTVTNEWQRFSYTDQGSTSSIRCAIVLQNSVGKQVDVWGAQLEESSYPTSYIKTEGATATRLADEITGAGDSSTFNSSEGVLFFEGSWSGLADVPASGSRLGLSDSTFNNRVSISFLPNTNQINYFLNNGGSTIVSETVNSINEDTVYKIAVKYSASEYKVYLGGSQIVNLSLNASTNSINDFSFDSVAGSNKFYGRVKQILVFNEALSDAELTSLTS